MQKDEPDHTTMCKQPGMSEIECNLTKANAKKIKITNANMLESKEKKNQSNKDTYASNAKTWQMIKSKGKVKKASGYENCLICRKYVRSVGVN